MTPSNGEDKRFVTNRELEEKLDKLLEKVPTRWEVRFLILAAIIATQILPPQQIAQAAVGLVS